MCLKWFREEEKLRADRDYQALYKIVRELDKQGLNKLITGVEALWEGYNALRTLKTIDEKAEAKEAKEAKESKEIDGAAGLIDMEMK